MIRIIDTKDGSHTLYREDIDETYHSRHGALSESIHVFIENGLNYWANQHADFKEVSILEIGFGTGLNATLTLQYSQSKNIIINYTTLEPFPLDNEIVNGINYFDDQLDLRNNFLMLHNLSFEVRHIVNNFIFEKRKIKLEEFNSNSFFDIIFFDAFAPEKQPELWDEEIFQKLFGWMNFGGVLTTYCAKGEFKRKLKRVGFQVTTLPGPVGGKREMVRGAKH